MSMSCADVKRTVWPAHAAAMPEVLGDVALAEAGLTEQQDVLALLYESTGCEVDDPAMAR